MQRGSIPVQAVVGLLCLGVLGAAGGCSGKRVAASSGDGSSTVKEKKTIGSVETVSPDPMVTIPPDDRRSMTESSDTPLTSSLSRDTETSSPPSPSPSSSLTGEAGSAGSTEGAVPSDLSGLGDVFFDFDQFVIRGDALPVMEANAEWIRRNSDKSIVIEGHCDERGTMAYNLVLGEKRARAAKRYLEELGIPPRGLKTISYGEVRPVCRDQNESCHQLNRRAHFVAQE